MIHDIKTVAVNGPPNTNMILLNNANAIIPGTILDIIAPIQHGIIIIFGNDCILTNMNSCTNTGPPSDFYETTFKSLQRSNPSLQVYRMLLVLVPRRWDLGLLSRTRYEKFGTKILSSHSVL